MHRLCKKDYSWNPSICFCENSGYLKSFADNSVIVYGKVVHVTDSVSPNVTKTISKNVLSTV